MCLGPQADRNSSHTNVGGEEIKAAIKCPHIVGGREDQNSWYTLFRVGNSITGIFGVLLGATLATQGLPQGEEALISVLHAASVMTFMFSWNAFNDVMDIEIDRVNRPNRPLPSGEITIESARRAVALTGTASIVTLAAAGYTAWKGETGIENWTPALVIWGIALFLFFNYESSSRFSFRMKERGLPGNIAISLAVGLVIIFGAASVSKPFDNRAWAAFFVGFLYNLSREIVKDIEDMHGDKGRRTFVMSAGVERSRLVAWLVLLAALVSLLTPFIPELEVFTPWHVAFVIPAVVTLMMVKNRLFASEDNAAQTLIKISMQLCLAAFFVISLIPV